MHAAIADADLVRAYLEQQNLDVVRAARFLDPFQES
jgi:hypothetical protein